jgi:hypothetical protein
MEQQCGNQEDMQPQFEGLFLITNNITVGQFGLLPQELTKYHKYIEITYHERKPSDTLQNSDCLKLPLVKSSAKEK